MGTQSHPLTLQVFLPGDSDEAPSIVAQAPIEEMRKQMPPPIGVEDMSTYASLQAVVILTPATIKHPGLIRVRALCGDNLLKMGALKIEKAPQNPPQHQT